MENLGQEVIFDHLHATAFQHTGLGRTILGPADNVRTITRANLTDYIAANYTASRMVVPLRMLDPPWLPCAWLLSRARAAPTSAVAVCDLCCEGCTRAARRVPTASVCSVGCLPL